MKEERRTPKATGLWGSAYKQKAFSLIPSPEYTRHRAHVCVCQLELYSKHQLFQSPVTRLCLITYILQCACCSSAQRPLLVAHGLILTFICPEKGSFSFNIYLILTSGSSNQEAVGYSNSMMSVKPSQAAVKARDRQSGGDLWWKRIKATLCVILDFVVMN